MSNATQKSGNSTLKWIFLGLAFIVLVTIISLGIKSCKVNHPKKVVSKTESKKVTWVVEERKTVYFTGEYSELIYLPAGRGFSFENSSEPYCVKCLSGNEVCGQKAEDIGSKLPKDSSSNTGLKFKSSNGKSGKITVVIWASIKI